MNLNDIAPLERLSRGIPSITTRDAESLSLYIAEQIGKIIYAPKPEESEA